MHRLSPLAAGLALAGLLGHATAADAAEPLPLLGTWHVLIHYRDASSPRPTQWRWEDRVWEFRTVDDQVVWTEYLLVHFVDASVPMLLDPLREAISQVVVDRGYAHPTKRPQPKNRWHAITAPQKPAKSPARQAGRV